MNSNSHPKDASLQEQNEPKDKNNENIKNEETSNVNLKLDNETSTCAPRVEVPELEMEEDANNVENIDNASSSSPEEVTRENSVEKDDIEPSSPEEINEDKKVSHTKITGKIKPNDDLKLLAPSNMVPPTSSKMSVKDRMAIGKF